MGFKKKYESPSLNLNSVVKNFYNRLEEFARTR